MMKYEGMIKTTELRSPLHLSQDSKRILYCYLDSIVMTDEDESDKEVNKPPLSVVEGNVQRNESDEKGNYALHQEWLEGNIAILGLGLKHF